MALTSRERLVRGYTMAIYVDGTRTIDSTNVTYHEEIKVCAAGLLSSAQIDDALAKARITEQEYLDTLAYVGTPEAEAWKSK